jgi:hypothetical protein
MSDKPKALFCLMCFVLGTAAPWGFIALGAVLSLASSNAANHATAAYLTAFGLSILAVSFLLKRLTNSIPRRVR